MKASICLIDKGKDTELKLTQRESGLGICVENVGCISLLQCELTSETKIQVDLITKLKGTQRRLFIDLDILLFVKEGYILEKNAVWRTRKHPGKSSSSREQPKSTGL